MEWLSVYARDQATMALVATAFPGSVEKEGESYRRKYVSQSEGYIGSLAMYLKRFCKIF